MFLIPYTLFDTTMAYANRRMLLYVGVAELVIEVAGLFLYLL